jgi:hypothetical protein
MELVTDPDKMNEFVIGIIPAELVAQTEELAQKVETKPEPRRMTVQRAKEAGYSGQMLTDKIVSGEIVIVDDD